MTERRPRRRWPYVVGFATVGLLGLAALGWLAFRDTTTPVPVSEAVDRFRTAEPAPTAPPAPTPTAVEVQVRRLPEPGVYVYRTTGSEEIDALSGATHDYPAETTITVRHEGCGAVHLWVPLEERFEEWAMCLDGDAWVMPWFTAFHEFFGNDDRQEYQCEPAVVLLSGDGEPAGGTCRSDGLTEAFVVTVVGDEDVQIDGETLVTTHLRIDVELTGDSTGGSMIDLWLDPVDGLVIRWRETVTSTNDSPIGAVNYDEMFEVELASRQVRR